jgi:hypothetical protein
MIWSGAGILPAAFLSTGGFYLIQEKGGPEGCPPHSQLTVI